ncbi:fasciclin-like arabinogalactan protein 4 [Impatiens glandulifera]|uniref:fasciclin-like arabinogalactan protein 4 n=1 Tax=Impatiens glandulifera TaxID=253017 RepID=UPI001FB0C52B|nr:fasciclin-like arabinogalactan protein 4 [Impatiens glandulifera]
MGGTSRDAHLAPFIILFLFSTNSISILTTTAAINITDLLSPFPHLSEFNNLLSSTSVAADLASRSSITILAVPNAYLRSPNFTRLTSSSATNLADVVRYHVLLQYLSWPDLNRIPPSGKLVTTLYQTTGRATNNFGSVNITHDDSAVGFSVRSPALSPSNASILSLVVSQPYNFSIFTINSVLVPSGFDLMETELRPLGINITDELIEAHDFNVAASLLAASGLELELERNEGGAGITMFIPTDEAFSDLPVSANFQSLAADKKEVVLKFHVLHSYYTLGSLQSIVNPVQPTLATEFMGAGTFTLNISRINGSVAINSGLIQATVTRTVFDQNPLAIFGVSNVLLPREIFGKNPVDTKPVGDGSWDAVSPESNWSPREDSPAGLLSPPGTNQDILQSEAVRISPILIAALWREGCVANFIQLPGLILPIVIFMALCNYQHRG